MANFSFDGTKSFDENFEAFLDASKGIDEELANILRTNADALKQIVREGERDTNARVAFNTAIADALDTLIASSDPSGGE